MATVKIPIDLQTPRVSSMAGNVFWSPKGLTTTDKGLWEFVKDVDGKLYGVAHLPKTISGTPNINVVLVIGANATAGVTRLNIATKFLAQDAESYNVTLNSNTAQDITVPGSARLTKKVTWSSGGDFASAVSDDIMIIEILHNGLHANDTLAVNTELVEAYLLVDIPGDANTGVTVEEVDGAPSVPNVTKIKVSNTTLVDNGGGVVTITTGGGGGGSIKTSTFAARPGAGTDGDLHFPSDGFFISRDNGSAWIPWGPIYPLTEPSDTGFSWVNQGGATLDTTKGGLYLEAPGAAGENLRCRVKSAPAAPYTITAGLILNGISQGNANYGLLFRESGTGKIITWSILYNFSMGTFKFTNATTFSATYLQITLAAHYIGPVVFLRLEDDNTNLKFYLSNDGQHFILFDTRARTDFMAGAPDEVGFYVNNVTATNLNFGNNVISWKEA